MKKYSCWNWCYSKRYYLTHPWKFFKDLNRNIKDICMRARYGFTWTDIWNWDHWFLHTTPQMLRHMADNGSAYPGKPPFDTPDEWHKPIFDCCRELGITPFSTPFDPAAVDFLESLDCPIYKISSFENGDIPLLKHVAQTHKPVIMSVGLIGPDEIQEAVTALTDNGCPEISLLKCTSAYPAAPKDFNLLTIQDLKRRFPQCKIGLSDHSIGIGVAITAVALGAEVIEKHFTISRADGGVDSAFSMEPDEMRQLVTECRIAQAAIGKVSYSLSADEQKSRKGRRSIYVTRRES